MIRIPYAPDAQAYSATPNANSVREVELEGGESYQRKGILNGLWTVTVQFTCDRDEYDILTGFHDIWENRPQFFLIELIVKGHELKEYQASFKRGTFKLVSQRGLSYIVSATLQVKPPRVSIGDNLNVARAIFVSIYGDEATGKRVAMDPLYETMNVIMPIIR